MKIKINVEWEVPSYVKRVLRVVVPVLIMATGGVAYASITTFTTGNPLSSATMNANFSDLDARLKAGRFVATIGSKQYSVGATVYCGTSPAPTGLALGGYAGAKAKCETAGGTCTASAHVCSPEEAARSVAVGLTMTGFVQAGAASYINTNHLIGDCGGFQSADAQNYGMLWNGTFSPDTCADTANPILCCD